MNPLLKIFFLHCWSNMYLMVGVCMGLSISLLLIPSDVTKRLESIELSQQPVNDQEDIDEYEPRINMDSKPQQAQKIPKAFVRPRYYSTELGIRERLFVGVITSQEYLQDRDVVLNKTIAHLVDKVRYFIAIPEGTKPNVSLPGIVGFTDTRSILKPFHAIKYIVDNYLEDYDYYFLVKDVSYINARKLMEFIGKISVRQDVHVGIQNGRQEYCSFDSGILLSNSIIRKMKTNLDWCVRNTYSNSDDVNFGRCLLHSTAIPCTTVVQGQKFSSTKLKPTFNFDRDFPELMIQEEFKNSLTIYPVFDRYFIYKINIFFAAISLIKIQEEIRKIRETILRSANFEPSVGRNVSWPIGNQPGNRALGRFDVLRWTYFNESYTFLEGDSSNVKKLIGDSKFDTERIINVAISNIIEKHDTRLKFKKLINGYRKFDASRGMDYVLDLTFTDVTSGKEIEKRIEICKPLGKVEILPVPYVTENTRINVILMVELSKKSDAYYFMERYARDCMEKKYKTFLMMVLFYNSNSPSKGRDDVFYDIKKNALTLSEKYRKDQLKVTWLSIRLPIVISSVDSEPMLKIVAADLCSRKFSSDSLVLFVETGTELRMDYLNRVRMNTIGQYQIYSPIPFTEFHPDVTYTDESQRTDIDINRNNGRYDEQNYNNIAFYVKDYVAMRRTVETSIPMARSDKDISNLLKLSQHSPVLSLFEMFVSFSDLHVLRAVEPALRKQYEEANCTFVSNKDVYKSCIKSKTYRLGRRGQLAKLVLEYRNFQI